MLKDAFCKIVKVLIDYQYDLAKKMTNPTLVRSLIIRPRAVWAVGAEPFSLMRMTTVIWLE